MAFCIFHQSCGNSGDNGNCGTWIPSRVVRVNRGESVCGCIDQSIVTGEKRKVNVRKRVGQQKQKKSR